MAIRMMVSREHSEAVNFANIEVVTNYHGSDTTLYMETSHIGRVLYTGEENGYDDSDFYALVWNPEKGEAEKVYYATTRAWTYPNSARVDATPEVEAAYKAWCEKKASKRVAAREAAEARTPRIGGTVRVVKGRKVPKGLVGEVFWTGHDKFRGGLRIGIRTPSGEIHFLAGSNVEVVSEKVGEAA